ncbi:hypothetical protein F1B95_08640 [Clostridium perfringens]|nr:hypothetical protein F1B95_08640 [Clostridium perfringens]
MSENLKISTIHSFKGWEIDTLVLILDENTDENLNEELIYTAITRCKKNLIIYGLRNSKYYNFSPKIVKKLKVCNLICTQCYLNLSLVCLRIMS